MPEEFKNGVSAQEGLQETKVFGKNTVSKSICFVWYKNLQQVI